MPPPRAIFKSGRPVRGPRVAHEHLHRQSKPHSLTHCSSEQVSMFRVASPSLLQRPITAQVPRSLSASRHALHALQSASASQAGHSAQHSRFRHSWHSPSPVSGGHSLAPPLAPSPPVPPLLSAPPVPPSPASPPVA